MKIPTYLRNYVKDCTEESPGTIITICSSDKNDLMEVWYYGDLYIPKGEHPYPYYIVDTEYAPALVIAKSPHTGEEILLMDGARHGYDNMFCDTYNMENLKNRPLKQLDIPASKIVLEVGYSIDYEDEKDLYELDETGKVLLIDGSSMEWSDVLTNGFDYIAIYYIDENGNRIQFLGAELA